MCVCAGGLKNKPHIGVCACGLGLAPMAFLLQGVPHPVDSRACCGTEVKVVRSVPKSGGYVHTYELYVDDTLCMKLSYDMSL